MTGLLTLAAGLALGTGALLAQEGGDGCRESQRSDPPRAVYECPDGLLVEVEAAAALRIRAERGAVPGAMELDERGVLIRSRDRSRPLQILTPHAVASVRGTTFVVDVEPGSTGVFAAEGAVAVMRADGSDEVMLGGGEGVDVAPGEPLVVRRWPAERVSALLARFAR